MPEPWLRRISSMILNFTNCRLCDNGTLVPGNLYIDTTSGKIVPPHHDAATVDLGGNILAPGFLDVQNNGVYGVNFSTLDETALAADVAQFRTFYRDAMAKYLRTGVTAMCPTVTSSTAPVYATMLPLYRKTRSPTQCDSLGAHVEGPFISHEKKGCHPEHTFVDAVAHLWDEVYGQDNLRQCVAIVTAAPEIPGVLDAMETYSAAGDVVCAIGHTLLDHATALAAVGRGARMVTHLYNAMPQPHHRNPGVVGLIALPDAGAALPYFGLICDGVHVAPSMVVLAYRANPDKCVLVTDTMHLFGLADGTYKWGAEHIVKKGTALRLQGTDTLAGAATDLPTGVRNLMRWAGVTLAQAVKTVTNNAAAALRLTTKGSLAPGCDADLVVLDDAGHVLAVYKLGVAVARAERAAML